MGIFKGCESLEKFSCKTTLAKKTKLKLITLKTINNSIRENALKDFGTNFIKILSSLRVAPKAVKISLRQAIIQAIPKIQSSRALNWQSKPHS